MNFKEQLARDVETVFHNSAEFAEERTVIYAGNTYKIPVIMDHTEATDRKQPSTDHADGLFSVDAVMYAAHVDLKKIPRKGVRIAVDGDDYEIISVGDEDGELVLGLQRCDE